MKVLVCGGRQFDDAEALASRFSEIHRDHAITEIIKSSKAPRPEPIRWRASSVSTKAFPFTRFRQTGNVTAALPGLFEIARCSRKGGRISLSLFQAGEARPTG
jgi:hypothetical protein